MPSPKRTPTKLRALRGNPGKRAMPKDEPQPGACVTVPDPPVPLGEIGQAEWDRIAPILVATRVLTLVDLGALWVACEAWEEVVAHAMIVREDGRVYTRENGMECERPSSKAKRDAMARYMSAAATLGLTPSDRSKVSIAPGPQEDNPLDRLRNRGRAGL